jgi:hypothetical protein
MKTASERFRRETKLPDEAIQRLVDRAIMDREQLEDLIRGDKDGRRMVADVTKLSEDELTKSLGWTELPGYSGVTLSGPCPLGGVLAPSDEVGASVSFAPAKRRASIPDHACLAEHYQSVRNQLTVGTCTAFATIATLEGQHNRIDLSEAFNYSLTKSRDGHPDTDGSWLRVSMPVLAEYGSCREETWRYKEDRGYLRQEPSASAFREARRFKPQSQAIAIRPKDIAAIRAQIASGRPVAVSLPIFRSSYSSLRFHSEGRFAMKMGMFDSVAGYHAMCCIGYFDNAFLTRMGQPEELGGGAFLVRNSWGTTWAKNNPLAKIVSAGPGYALIPFGYVEGYCFGAFTVAVTSASLRRNGSKVVAAATTMGGSWWLRTREGAVAAAKTRLADAVK